MCATVRSVFLATFSVRTAIRPVWRAVETVWKPPTTTTVPLAGLGGKREREREREMRGGFVEERVREHWKEGLNTRGEKDEKEEDGRVIEPWLLLLLLARC